MRRPISIVLLLALQSQAAFGAIALDSTTSATQGTQGTTGTFTGIVIGNNANRFLLVAVGQRDANINNVTGCTFNTTETMTKVTSIDGTGAANVNESMWYLLNPSVTTASAVCTSSNSSSWVFGSISLSGVNQSTPFRDQGGNNWVRAGGASATGTGDQTLSTVAGDFCISAVHAGDCGTNATNIIPGGSADERWDRTIQNCSETRNGGATFTATATSTVMSFTWTGSQLWAVISVAIQPAATAGPLFKRYYDLLRSSLFDGTFVRSLLNA